ncbi:MAG: hypothetical protein EZS28_008982 [Streblomastix strix]|uniref:Uncharacterized protein n=1 Tax=Streblomastix strix TaxID=222440 RepID=A0A5J4WLQ1_9EUKA|nr:MAG: hypothetical protein EZS28_008982 [Streblomastix strix]
MTRLFDPQLERLQYAISVANKKVTSIRIFYNQPTIIKQRIIRSSTIQIFSRSIQKHDATIDMHRKAVTAVYVTHEKAERLCEVDLMIW